ncbi:hypothetical protein M3667_08055 [Microbacterium sp. P26]|uniref:hypothetical protein n=1 Tax=Microbacterium TaxID=33882 RepID=UPI00203C08EE|nr:hypothetical protein [Microbacterium sp. P26]MCM3501824.1 hypothetical protein [Microbacterium sp. P26]
MAWNDRAPQDRATAQIIICFGGMVSVVGIALFWGAAASGALGEITRRGIPVWLLAPLCIAFGVVLIWRGIVMHRSDKSPRR